jgi:rhomboid protease GluP
LIDAGAMVPATGGTISGLTGGIVGGEYWRLLSSMFLHAGLLHLAFNAYALWIFGAEVERDIGSWSTLAVYFVTGVFAGAASYAFTPDFFVGVGASGAIFGMLGAFIVYNYRRRQHMWAQARVRGAVMLLLFNLVLGFIPGIDWRAHIGGLIAGFVAGYAVDPDRPPALRRVFTVAGMLALLLGSVALVAFRTAQIQADPSILFPGS